MKIVLLAIMLFGITAAMLGGLLLWPLYDPADIYRLPRFTERFIVTPGIAGPGVLREDFPLVWDAIATSGCVELGGYFGATAMNCVLARRGSAIRVMSNTEATPSIQAFQLELSKNGGE
jgi:hypothetical protein